MAIVNKNPEYFITIASEKSISKAAEILYVSQSYLSQHISKLESSFGVKLLDRSKLPIDVTPAGYIYLNYLESCNRLYSKLISDFDSLSARDTNTLHLGIAPWRGSTLLPDILPEYMKNNSNVQVYLHEHPGKQLISLIEKNAIDIAIGNYFSEQDNCFDVELIKYEKIMLVVNKRNPLCETICNAAVNGKFNLSILQDECFILMEEGMSCAERVRNYMKNASFVPRRQITTSSKITACNLVAQNMGCTFMPESGVKWAARSDEMEFIDIKSVDLIAPLAAIYKKGTFLSRAARNFILTVKKYYDSKTML